MHKFDVSFISNKDFEPELVADMLNYFLRNYDGYVAGDSRAVGLTTIVGVEKNLFFIESVDAEDD